MNRSKKVVSSILAVLMLISMLACFSLPATAEALPANYYYIATANEWNDLADDINANSNGEQTDTTLRVYIQCDIDFENTVPTQIEKFAGKLDGNGYTFSNISMSSSDQYGASLIKTLEGTIQNLTLASTCSFKNTYTSNFLARYYYAQSGAFAAISNGGFIKKCASYATYTATGSYARVGGFVGKSTGVTIDGCIFGGTVSNTGSNSTAGAFIGYLSGGTSTISYSLARGTVTAKSSATADASCFATNSYVVADSAYGSAKTNADINEAVWRINDARIVIEPDEDKRIFLSVDINDVPCFGNKNDRVVRMWNTENDVYTYHAPRSLYETYNSEGKLTASYSVQTEITPDAPADGQVLVVEGAEYIDGTIYVGGSDITVTYADATAQAQEQLSAMIEAYNNMDSAYVTIGDTTKAWLTNAQSALISTSVETINRYIESGYNRDDVVKTDMTTLDAYPSIAKYNTYKYTNITDYKVESAEDWLAAVNMSNYVENPDAVNFPDITLHLTADINMNDAEMKPLCYGWIFDGDLDGHDHTFQNINIVVDSSYGPVGLIGTISETDERIIQNLGVESGTIQVTGWPRHKKMLAVGRNGNYVAGIVGKNHAANTLIRKCWNNVDFSAENIWDTAGIIADPQNAAIIDSCFNLGQTGDLGISGHGRRKAIICNSMSGPVKNSAVSERADVVTNANYEGRMERNFINICGVKSTLEFTNFSSTTSYPEDYATQKDEETNFNQNNTEFSNAAAAWKVNANYKQQPYGNKERIYYTLNENGEVRFGASDGSDQIYRIAMVCEQNCDGDGEASCTDHPTRYTYGVREQEIELNFDFGANYFACENEKVTISENTLTFREDIVTEGKTITVHVGLGADRGNANGDAAGKINVLDVLKAVRLAVANEITLADKKNADLNCDYIVDINDAYQIVRYVFDETYREAPDFTPGKSTERKENYLKVLSYNIKGGFYDPTISGGSGAALSRIKSVAAELAAIDADIVGLQEVLDNCSGTNYESVLENLLDVIDPDREVYIYSDYVETRPFGSHRGGNAIISKYPVVDSDSVFFDGKARLDGDTTKKLDDTDGSPRAFTWYKISTNGNGTYEQGKDIIYYNIHFATNGNSDEQLQYMVDFMNENHANDRVVCTGDFNLPAYTMEKVLADLKNMKPQMTTEITALNGGERFDTFVATNANSGSMIDNILINQNVEYFKTGEKDRTAATSLSSRRTLYGATDGEVDNENGWTASDHLPVWAYIKK